MAYARGYEPQNAANRLLAGDASKVLVAAPGDNKRLRILKLNYQVVVSAAQAVDVGVSGGGVTKQVLSLASAATGTGGVNLGERGFPLDENVALTAVPGAAGPAIQFQVEYYVEDILTP